MAFNVTCRNEWNEEETTTTKMKISEWKCQISFDWDVSAVRAHLLAKRNSQKNTAVQPKKNSIMMMRDYWDETNDTRVIHV